MGSVSGIDAAMNRVERLLPPGIERTGATSGSNFRTRTYRLPEEVDAVVASIRKRHGDDSTLGPPSFDAPAFVSFWIPGNSECDGKYFVSLTWKPSQSRTAELRGNCED
jgi:hypothetical protein